MDDLDVLARDFGLRPGGKSAPMRSDGGDRRSASARSSLSSPFFDDREGPVFNDVFGGPPKYTNSNTNNNASTMNDFDYDSIFKSGNDPKNNTSKTSSLPVYDKPVYDDDVFDGMPGLKSKSVSSSTSRFDDDVFASVASQPKKNHNTDQFDDLLGNFGKNEKVTEAKSSKSSSSRGFDDLLAGFGSGNAASTNRSFTESNQPSKLSGNSNRTSSTMDDPFGVLDTSSINSPGVFSDPLEGITKPGKSGSAKVDSSSVWGSAFDELDPLNSFGRSVPPFSPERNKKRNDESPTRDRSGRSEKQTSTVRENTEESSFRNSESHSHKTIHGDSFAESLFDTPATDSQKSFSQDAASSPYPQYASVNRDENSSQVDMAPRSDEQVQVSEDIWITVSEVPLVTQPTSAPPPSWPPPPIPRQTSKSGTGFFASHPWRGDDYSSPPSYSQYSQSPKTAHAAAKSSPVSQLDELEEFAMGRTQNSVDGTASALSGEEMNANSVAAASAAAMKEAMDRAEAKFRRAKEVREREYAKAARTNVQLDKDEQDMHEMQDREFKEDQERLERERRQRVKEEEEREQRRLEREREKAREIERERARQAVERATREVRERAAAEARERAAAEARMKAERAAVEKAAAEARERAERAAVQRAQAEARERAAAEARDRANAEAKEREAREKAAAAKAQAEARRRAERAAVERAAAEARERAAAEARERAAAAASRVNQQKNDNDLESFFSMGSRASSAPRPRASSPETMFDMQFQNKGGSEGAKATSSFGGATSNMRKASSTTNIVDDLSSIFGAAPSSGEFQEVEGESEERRRARLERHQRTQERAAKALAEKNQRDLQVQREQEERHRIAETLDIEIKRWAAGKEGNLRALLSTLQYVLWPECGWQPVSLTDLITGASVKKVYRKATLCIHPDKVQQKGATLQQKYIAEKVFDLLKEAWNKFNSEELF